MSGQPSVRQLATDMATLGTALESINTQLAEMAKRLEKIQKLAAIATNLGHTPDGYTLTGNIGIIRSILEREFD